MKKVLYKIEKGKQVEGVCGGLAEYFSLDPTLIRLAWVLFTLCSLGTGIVFYFIAALVMPRKSEVIKRK